MIENLNLNYHTIDIIFDFPKEFFKISVKIKNGENDEEYLKKFFPKRFGKLKLVRRDLETDPSKNEFFDFKLDKNLEYVDHIILGSQRKLLINVKFKDNDLSFITPEIDKYDDIKII